MSADKVILCHIIVIIGFMCCFFQSIIIVSNHKVELNAECRARCGMIRVDMCNDNGIQCGNGKYYVH